MTSDRLLHTRLSQQSQGMESNVAGPVGGGTNVPGMGQVLGIYREDVALFEFYGAP